MSLRALFGSRPMVDAARGLYSIAVIQARQPEFYLSLTVPDTVDGRFDLVALHVFLILHRLGKSGRDARDLAQSVFDVMFADMDENLRELGVSDLAVGKRVKAMAQAFYGRISAYEGGLADDNELEAALARNLYRGVPVENGVLKAMAAYIRREDAALEVQSLADMKEGRVCFGAPIMP